jgi:hypothetical protein
MIRPKKFIGLTIEEKAVIAADIRQEKDRFVVSNTKVLVFHEGADLKEPETLGRALGQFLQENRFSGRKAIIGVPAKWLMLREKVLPSTTDRESVTGILKIHAEREFSLSPDELVLDYTSLRVNDKSNRFFLIAMLKANLDKVILAVRWAGLNVISITPSSIALFSMLRKDLYPPAPHCFLYIREDYAEFVARDREQAVDVKYIQKSINKETGLFIAELRRIMSFYYGASIKENGEQLLIWNATGVPCRQELKAVDDSLSPDIKIVEANKPPVYDKLGLKPGESAGAFIAPSILAGAFNNPDPFYVDFLNSRMHAKIKVIKQSQILWASAAAAGMVIIFLVLFFLWRGNKKEIAGLRLKLNDMQGDVTFARDVIKKVADSDGWYSNRPKIMECLKQLTTVFPEEGRIWATNLALSEEMKGVISGRASDEKTIIDIMDLLKENRNFSDVQMIYLQGSNSNTQDVSFSMNFSFTGGE